MPKKALSVNPRCWYCGTELDLAATSNKVSNRFTRDHQIPRSRGGSSDPSNIVPACFKCNVEKGTKTVSEYKFHIRAKASPIGKMWAMLDEIIYDETFPEADRNILSEIRSKLTPPPPFVCFYGEGAL